MLKMIKTRVRPASCGAVNENGNGDVCTRAPHGMLGPHWSIRERGEIPLATWYGYQIAV